MGEKGLMEEDWNDRSNCRKKIIVKWAKEDVKTLYNLLNNDNDDNNNNNNVFRLAVIFRKIKYRTYITNYLNL
jgi:hypothetical protein